MFFSFVKILIYFDFILALSRSDEINFLKDKSRGPLYTCISSDDDIINISMKYEDGYPPTINNEICANNLLKSASKIVGTGVGSPYLSMGGEDFSYFANEIPGCFFFIGSCPKNSEPLSTPHHCSHFDIDEDSLLVGASVFVQLIEDQLI